MKIWQTILASIPLFTSSKTASENQNFLAYQITSVDQSQTIYLLGTMHVALESTYAKCLEDRYSSFFDRTNPASVQFELSFNEMDAVLNLSQGNIPSSTEGYIYHEAESRDITLSQKGLESYVQQIVFLKNPLKYAGQFLYIPFYSKALLKTPYFMHLLSFVLNKDVLFTWGPLFYQNVINRAPRSYAMAVWQSQRLVDMTIEYLRNRIYAQSDANELRDIQIRHIEGYGIVKSSVTPYQANAVVASEIRSSIWYRESIQPHLKSQCVDDHVSQGEHFLKFLNDRSRVVLEALRPVLEFFGQDITSFQPRAVHKDLPINVNGDSLDNHLKECPAPVQYDDPRLLYPQNKMVFAVGANHLPKLLELAQNDGFEVTPIPFNSCKI